MQSVLIGFIDAGHLIDINRCFSGEMNVENIQYLRDVTIEVFDIDISHEVIIALATIDAIAELVMSRV